MNLLEDKSSKNGDEKPEAPKNEKAKEEEKPNTLTISRAFEFDIQAFKDSPRLFTGMLRKDNCCDPFIMGYFRQQDPRIFYWDKWMIEGYNSAWYSELQMLRNGIQLGNYGWIVAALERLYGGFQKADFPFNDFLEFEGIFDGCAWFRQEGEGQLKDIICYPDMLPVMGFDEKEWKTFIPGGMNPKDELSKAFGKYAEMKTAEIAELGYEKNPLAQILQNDIEPERSKETFDRAMKFLRYLYKIKVIYKEKLPHEIEEERIIEDQRAREKIFVQMSELAANSKEIIGRLEKVDEKIEKGTAAGEKNSGQIKELITGLELISNQIEESQQITVKTADGMKKVLSTVKSMLPMLEEISETGKMTVEQNKIIGLAAIEVRDALGAMKKQDLAAENEDDNLPVGMWDDLRVSFYVHNDLSDADFTVWVKSSDRSTKMTAMRARAKKNHRMLKAKDNENSQAKFTWNSYKKSEIWMKQRYRKADHLRPEIMSSRLEVNAEKRLCRALNHDLKNAIGFLEQYAEEKG